MILLQINQLNKYFGADLILSNIKLEIQTRDRIALVGRNGAGKSTLLKIIADKENYESGEIIKPKDVTIGYLDQHTGLHSSKSIWDEMLTVFRHLQEMEIKLRQLEQKMADSTLLSNVTHYEKIMSDYDQLLNNYKDLGGYQYESDIRSVLHGLNFQGFDYSSKISSLSGGQKTRLALAKLLLSKPDILILDEPTNHLDIETLSWLEQYLQAYEGAILIVSHDRYFLDKIVNQVYELAQMTLTKYPGNYSKYLVQKAENYKRDLKLYERQQEEIVKMKDFIQKNLARASTTKRAQSRRRTLERMTILDRPQGDEKSASFSFDIERQSGNEVLNIKDLTIGYNDNVISRAIQFRITRGESVALLGPNGIGKSTLLKTIIKKLQSLNGSIQLGTNVSIGYYDQEQANLTSNKRVLNELWDDYPTVPEKDIRNTLGNFLFSGEDVLKTVSTLSGGEKARLALAKLMMQQANFLILDEPTNHLDLDSKEILENALIDYPGTILFVSHDRYFINRIATKVIEMSSEGVQEYLGDYDYFIEKKQEIKELEELKQQELEKNQKNTFAQTKNSYEVEKEARRLERQRKRRMEEIEQQIEVLEEEVKIKEKQMFNPSISSDHEQLAILSEEVTHTKAEIEQLLEEWALLVDQNENGVAP